MLERMQIAAGFVPVNLAAGGNNSDWVNLENYGRVLIVFFKAARGKRNGGPDNHRPASVRCFRHGIEGHTIARAMDEDRRRPDDNQFTADAPSTNTLTVASRSTRGHLGHRRARRNSIAPMASTAFPATSLMSARSSNWLSLVRSGFAAASRHAGVESFAAGLIK